MLSPPVIFLLTIQRGCFFCESFCYLCFVFVFCHTDLSVCLSSWGLMIVVWLFLTMLWVCLQFVIVVFPDHTHLLLLELHYTVIHLQLWAYWFWDLLFHISISPNCELMSPEHYFNDKSAILLHPGTR